MLCPLVRNGIILSQHIRSLTESWGQYGTSRTVNHVSGTCGDSGAGHGRAIGFRHCRRAPLLSLDCPQMAADWATPRSSGTSPTDWSTADRAARVGSPRAPRDLAAV